MLEHKLHFQNAKEWNMRLTAHARVGNLQRALGMPREMRSAGVAPDVITYNRLIKACERDWQNALVVLKEMRDEGITPDVFSYNAAISACEKGGRSKKALSLLDQMRAEDIKPDVITYSAAISACEKGGQSKEALSLLTQMRRDGITPNVISYTAIIQACASAGQPDEALRIFEEAQRKVEVNRVTYNAILDAVCTSDPAKAHELYSLGRSLYGPVESTENATPKLDLHQHSEGAGETAVRWWLEERVPGMSGELKQVIIVTGWGKSRSAIQDGDLRGRVERLLAELRVPTLPNDNQGRFVVDAQAWRRQQARSDAHPPISPQPPSPDPSPGPPRGGLDSWNAFQASVKGQGLSRAEVSRLYQEAKRRDPSGSRVANLL